MKELEAEEEFYQYNELWRLFKQIFISLVWAEERERIGNYQGNSKHEACIKVTIRENERFHIILIEVIPKDRIGNGNNIEKGFRRFLRLFL